MEEKVGGSDGCWVRGGAGDRHDATQRKAQHARSDTSTRQSPRSVQSQARAQVQVQVQGRGIWGVDRVQERRVVMVRREYEMGRDW